MPGPLPYNVVERFYEVLDDHKNEDGYAVCTAQYAGKVAGMSQGTVKTLARRLHDMGVLKVYTASPTHKDLRAGEFMIIKIVSPLTKQKYADHFLGEFDRQYEEKRKARLERILPP